MTPALKAMVEAMVEEVSRQVYTDYTTEDPSPAEFVNDLLVDGRLDLEKVARAGRHPWPGRNGARHGHRRVLPRHDRRHPHPHDRRGEVIALAVIAWIVWAVGGLLVMLSVPRGWAIPAAAVYAAVLIAPIAISDGRAARACAAAGGEYVRATCFDPEAIIQTKPTTTGEGNG